MLGSRSKIAVLRVLRGVRIPLNASQIAARTGLTSPVVTSVLRTLAAMGVVRSSSAGRANVHLLEHDNILVTQLLDPLFTAEERLADAVLEDLLRVFGDIAESVVLFGSFARGDHEPESDVDVVLVARDPSAKEVVERAADSYGLEFRTRFGATLSPIVYESGEAAALRESAPGLFESLRRDAIVVSGSRPSEWAKRG